MPYKWAAKMGEITGIQVQNLSREQLIGIFSHIGNNQLGNLELGMLK